MFSIFSKCIHRPDTDKTATKITFLVVGLDNAGKSTTAKGLQVKAARQNHIIGKTADWCTVVRCQMRKTEMAKVF